MKRGKYWVGFLLIGLMSVTNLLAQGGSTPSVTLKPFLTGLSRPLLLTNAKDGSNRLFIVQQGGIIKVLQPGSTTPADFINISSRSTAPVNFSDERGLLGMAFHPQFAANGKFYVNYTRIGDGATVIAEYRTIAGNPNQGDLNSERIVLLIPQPFANHNGGMIEFGPDGFLYIGMGDGGSGNDPGNRAQNRAELLGKMLRIDVNVPAGSSVQYLIPPGNPFTGANTARCDGGSTTAGNTCQEIWAIGMRNPYRWSFDRGGTRQLWAGDVGQDAIEEVDIITAGANYGWRVYEGTRCTNIDPALCTTPNNFTPPVFEYNSATPDPRCSVTGGYVYRGAQGVFPNGAYIYADYCTGEIMMWQNNQQILVQDTARLISSFGEDESGELYVVGLGGTVDKITGVVTRQKAPFDFDGDGKTDLSIFRHDPGEWWYLRSSDGGNRAFQFGNAYDRIAPADYTGDGKTDIAFFRRSNSSWFILRSEDNSFYSFPFGASEDIPAPADYDGDGRADAAVFRPSNSTWYISRSSGGTTIQQFGLSDDIPVTADYDGDGKSDIAIYRMSKGEWWISRSSAGVIVYQFGIATADAASTDYPVQGDYTGDGKADVAFFRPSTGEWFILRSENNSFYSFPFGTSGDVLVPGDYDGDGRTDAAVFRSQNRTWFVQRSSSGTLIQQFGISIDRPVPNAYVPQIAIAVP